MDDALFRLLFDYIPQYLFAILLYSMCMKSGEKQRTEYIQLIRDQQGTIDKLIDELKDVRR